jgi:hypothetical protein
MAFILGIHEGKVTYATFEIASLVGKKVSKAPSQTSKPYKCEGCGGYHYDLIAKIEEKSPNDAKSS